MIRFRIAALLLSTCFIVTACGGGGGTSFLGGSSNGSGSSGGTTPSSGSRPIAITLTIPSAGASSSSRGNPIVSTASSVRKPQTISPGTASITVSVNGGAPQIFNITACTGYPNLTCVLNVGATYGLDSFLIITWSGPNGTGTELNAAAITLNVSQSGPNTASATAGNVLTVNSSGDGSGGSNTCASGSTTCTLREAVAEASTAAGVYTALLFTGVTSITVGSPITINNQSIIIIGPGALVGNTSGSGAPSASGNLTISGGSTAQIFHVTAGSLAVDGVTLTGGVPQTSCPGEDGGNCGGAIENYGTLSIVNTIFNANGSTGTGYGGAVFDESNVGATTSVVYSTFTGNKAQEGGAYFIEESTPTSGGAVFANCIFANNIGSDGSSNGEGGAIYADWNLSVASSTFTANVAGSATAGGFYGEAGAIDIEYNSSSPTISNSTFGGSSASAGNIAGGTGPDDAGRGGAIYNDGDNPLALSGNTFANNVARGGDDAYGGAIVDYEGITSTNDTFSNNLVDASAATSSDSGYAYGGAVSTDYNSSWTSDAFTSNQAKGGLATNGAVFSEAYGGAIYSQEGDPAIIAVTQTTFSTNSASAASTCFGGGVYTDWDDNSLAVPFTNVQFTGNSCTATGNSDDAYAQGGGLYVYYGLVSLETVTFTNNSVTAHYTPSDTTYGAVALGGGFAYEDGYYNCDQCSFRRRTPESSSATAADAARVTRDQTHQTQMLARMLAVHTRHASSKHAARAIIHAHAPLAIRRPQSSAPNDGIDSSTFTGNSATAIGLEADALGGGIDISGQPTITNSTFSNNSATWSGGGTGGFGGGGAISTCAWYDGEYPSISATVSGNTATNAGGGIVNECYGTTILNSTISGNSAVGQNSGDGGGGVYNYGEALLISGSTLTANSVTGSVADSGGGGFNNFDDDAMILNSTIYNNKSSVDGGGIENASYAEVELVNATVYQNTATGNGGGVSNDRDGASPGNTYVYAANTILAGNTAANGSDIWNLDTFYSYGYNLVQQSSNYGSGTSNAPQGGDLIGVSPALASGLASNGGPTQTIADTSSSPGKGVIPFASSECNGWGGTNVDQRGYARGTGNVCDIGAYEFSGIAPAQSQTAQSVRKAVKFIQRKPH